MGKYCASKKEITLKWKEIWLEMKGISYQGRKDTKKMPQELDYESAMQHYSSKKNWMPTKAFIREPGDYIFYYSWLISL